MAYKKVSSLTTLDTDDVFSDTMLLVTAAAAATSIILIIFNKDTAYEY